MLALDQTEHHQSSGIPRTPSSPSRASIQESFPWLHPERGVAHVASVGVLSGHRTVLVF